MAICFILYVRKWHGLIGASSCRFDDKSSGPWCDLHNHHQYAIMHDGSYCSGAELARPSWFYCWLSVYWRYLLVNSGGTTYSQCAETVPVYHTAALAVVCFRLSGSTQDSAWQKCEQAAPMESQWSPAPAPMEPSFSIATLPCILLRSSSLPVCSPWPARPHYRRTGSKTTNVPAGRASPSVLKQCWWRAPGAVRRRPASRPSSGIHCHDGFGHLRQAHSGPDIWLWTPNGHNSFSFLEKDTRQY